jgi:hypothetical protein
MLGEVGGDARPAVRLDVGRRRRQHQMARCNAARDQAGVVQNADADSEIPALVGQVDQPIAESEFDPQARIAAAEFGQQRRDLPRVERHRRVLR